MPPIPGPPRKIVHVDMDAFYAAIEQRDRPELRGRPVIVGGSPKSRGVVCTASYEARRFGVRSAMSCAQAARLCPEGIFVTPDFKRYVAASEQIREVFFRYTDLVEPLSLDEAYLDVTANKLNLPSATWIAERIRADIFRETQLTASAGVAPNKFLAKVASDLNKPNGLAVIPPERVEAFLRDLPVRKVPGIGAVTEEICLRHGIRTCSDFLKHTEEELTRWFRSAGPAFRQLAEGIDQRPVIADHVRKSCGIEDTFERDLTSIEEAQLALAALAEGLERRLKLADTRGRTVTLKVKYDDFQTATRSRTLDVRIQDREILHAIAFDLLAETEVGRRPVRLLGIQVSHLDTELLEEQLHFPFVEDLCLDRILRR